MSEASFAILQSMIETQSDHVSDLLGRVGALEAKGEATISELQGVRRRLHELSDGLQTIKLLDTQVGSIGKIVMELDRAAIRMEAATKERERMIGILKWMVGILATEAGAVTTALVWATQNIESVVALLRGSGRQ